MCKGSSVGGGMVDNAGCKAASNGQFDPQLDPNAPGGRIPTWVSARMILQYAPAVTRTGHNPCIARFPGVFPFSVTFSECHLEPRSRSQCMLELSAMFAPYLNYFTLKDSTKRRNVSLHV